MSSQPIKRYAPPPPWSPPLSLPRSCSHHHCCSFDLIPLTSADLSKRRRKREGREGMEGKAYYPSSSALNYLNANDVRGRERERARERERERERGKWWWGGRRARGKWERESASVCLAGEDKTQQRGANLLLLGVSGSSLVILRAG